MKIYKTQSAYLLSNSIFFIFPLLMTLVIIAEEEVPQLGEWVGVVGFWLVGLVVIIFMKGLKLEIGDDYIKGYSFGFQRNYIKASDIEAVEYGNLFPGGLGVGKGLKIWVKTPSGGHKYYTFGEKAYGKEAIEHVKRVLQK